MNARSGQEARAIASELGIHPAIASVLMARGVTTRAEIQRFLNPTLESLETPFAFRDMKKAVDRIKRAIGDKEKILVYGDYDVDGVTGSSILYPALRRLGADADVYIPHRVNEGYGLNLESLRRLLEKPYRVVITVDNGITGVEAVKFLTESGVDVIIVDHHVPKESLPDAYAIVSACVDGQGDSGLAACGLAFKVVWALTGRFEDAKEYLDLVALGTVADLAPVTGDNRTLLKFGLPILAATRKPGLRALMDVAKVQRKQVGYRDIAFGLAPRINAAGRMGSPETAFRLLTTFDLTEAADLAQRLDDGNRDRQRVEAEAYEEAAEKIDADPSFENDPVLVLESARWHEGILGIVAARLVERYRKPSIVITHRSGVGKGSGRSIPTFSLFDTVLRCEDLLMNFGGHAQACGLTIDRDKIAIFRERLNEAAVQAPALQAERTLAVDDELPLSDIDLKFLRDLERLAPFGPGNPKPLYLSKGLKVKGLPKKRGKDTLQCWLSDDTGRTTCELIGFRAYRRWMESPPQTVDIIHRPALSEFNGIASIQLELEDWR